MANIETKSVLDKTKFDDLAKEGADKLILVPLNFESSEAKDYLFASSLPTVLKLAKRHDIPLSVYPPNEPELLEQRSIEWFAPAIFVSSLYLTQNPNAVSVALSMLANYLTTLFSGREDAMARLEVYLRNESTGETKQISYKGPPAGIKDIQGALEALTQEKK